MGARTGLRGLLVACAVLASACDEEPPVPTYEDVVLVQDVAARGGLVLVANDLGPALAAPAGTVPEQRLHDLLVLQRDGDGLSLLGTHDSPDEPKKLLARRLAVDVARDLAYLGLGAAGGEGWVEIVDLADPAAPVGRGIIEVGDIVTGLAASGSTLFVGSPSGLQSFDVSDPDAPLPLGGWVPDDGATLSGLFLDGSRLYVAAQGSRLQGGLDFLFGTLRILDVTDAASPAPLGRFDVERPFQSGGRGVAVQGGRAFLLTEIGLEVLDVSDPGAIVRLGGVDTDPTAPGELFADFSSVGSVVLLATQRTGLRAVELADPAFPDPLSTLPGSVAPPLSQATSVAVDDGQVYLGISTVGVRVLEADRDRDDVVDLVDICPDHPDPGQEDQDGDGPGDACDVCVAHFDPFQIDADGDGYGNRCDPDFDQDGVVNFSDLAVMRARFFQEDFVVDLDADGVVNFSDLAIVRTFFFQPPGPSAFAGPEAPEVEAGASR